MKSSTGAADATGIPGRRFTDAHFLAPGQSKRAALARVGTAASRTASELRAALYRPTLHEGWRLPEAARFARHAAALAARRKATRSHAPTRRQVDASIGACGPTLNGGQPA
ncbi:MAG: hypothetical protein AMXMBFR66_20980 [Pseudomonadota bacterium]|nr:hypothetical protein [Rubrivivax sp.]